MEKQKLIEYQDAKDDYLLNLKEDVRLKDIPIVVMSADAFTNQQEKVKNMGVPDYITKPINKDYLILILKKHLKYHIV